MEQEKENQAAEAVPPTENDLFSIAEPQEPTPAPASGSVSEPAPAAPDILPEQPAEAPARPTGNFPAEPEFKINPEDRPSIRILNDTAAPKSDPPPVSKTGTAPVSLRSALGSSVGTMLTEARAITGYSIEDVHQLTQIKSAYIEALEKDDIDSLPSYVFMRAYVRALIATYRLDEASAAMIEEQMAELEPDTDIPEKIVESIGRDGQINEAEARRVKMILIYGAIILLLLISLTVTSIVSVRIRNRRIRARNQQAEQVFDSNRIDTLLAPQLPPPRMMEVPAEEQNR